MEEKTSSRCWMATPVKTSRISKYECPCFANADSFLNRCKCLFDGTIRRIHAAFNRLRENSFIRASIMGFGNVTKRPVCMINVTKIKKNLDYLPVFIISMPSLTENIRPTRSQVIPKLYVYESTEHSKTAANNPENRIAKTNLQKLVVNV